MDTQKFFNQISVAMLVLTTCLMSSQAMAEAVGKMMFSAGDVTITHADKSTSKGAKDLDLNVGDTIETKQGRVQFSLIDGGKVSLQPNSVYKINKYVYNGKEDGSEYAFTELVKGGLRTISGAVGHKNRERYQLKTSVATIGIRGTEFTVNLDNNNLLMTTNQGSVEVCNGNGCLIADAGMSIHVHGNAAKPIFSNIKAVSQAAPPSTSKPTFAVADVLQTDGTPVVLSNTEDKTALNNYDGKGMAAVLVRTSCNCAFDHVFEAEFMTDSEAIPTEITADTGGDEPHMHLFSGYKESHMSDGVIAIGRVWDSAGSNAGTYQDNNSHTSAVKEAVWLDYIVGEKPAPGKLNNLTGTYTVFASTAPILVANGVSSQVGAANRVSGNFQFNFSNGGSYSYSLNVPTTGATYSLSGTGSSLDKNNPTFATGGTVSATGTAANGACGSPSVCSGALSNGNLVQGVFIGKDGTRVGLQYGVSAAAGNIYGSAALGPNGSTSSVIQ